MEINIICPHKYILSNVELPISIYRKISKKNLLSLGRGPTAGTEEGAMKQALSSPFQINTTKKKKAGLVPDPQTLHITPNEHQGS